MEIHTSICHLDEENHKVEIFGLDLIEISQSYNFEKTAFLLLNHKVPTDDELFDFTQRGYATRKGVADIASNQQLIVKPMEMLQSLSATLNYYYDPWDYINQLLMSCATFLRPNLEAIPNYEAQVMHILTHEESENYDVRLRAISVLLNLYSEHELNASTLVARVVASTGAPFHRGVSAAIGALSGPLHGGANEKIIPFISSLSLSDYQERVDEILDSGQKIMGFGHAIYKDGDPRSPVAMEIAQGLISNAHQRVLFDLARRVAERVQEKKNLHPNLDYYAAIALHFLGIDPSHFTPFFVFSRITGWASHILEQKAQKKIIRPRAVYR